MKEFYLTQRCRGAEGVWGKLSICLLVAGAASWVAFAVPEDTSVGLGEVGLPVYGATGANSGYSQPDAAYPISAACAPVLSGEQVTGSSTKDSQITWTLAAWTVGRTLSEQMPDAKIGDYCDDRPFDDRGFSSSRAAP